MAERYFTRAAVLSSGTTKGPENSSERASDWIALMKFMSEKRPSTRAADAAVRLLFPGVTGCVLSGLVATFDNLECEITYQYIYTPPRFLMHDPWPLSVANSSPPRMRSSVLA